MAVTEAAKACFFDSLRVVGRRQTGGQFVRIAEQVVERVLGEHAPGQVLRDASGLVGIASVEAIYDWKSYLREEFPEYYEEEEDWDA